MTDGNKTSHFTCRYLTENDFSALHKTFIEAFSDYFIPFQLTEAQLTNHILQNSVALERSVGAFENGRMIGFTLNGFGRWNERNTIYDAGTGVIPAHRNRGVGKTVFDFMIPMFQKDKFEQILLEVISENEAAVRLYRKLGFEETRRLVFFERKTTFEDKPQSNFEIREINRPDWLLFEKFSDGKTSWQNSAEAIRRSQTEKIIVGAFLKDELAGYGVIFPKSGIITQIAVRENFRRGGAGTAILGEMQRRLEKDKMLRASNIDENIESAVGFFKKNGFGRLLDQIEMVKKL